MKFKSSNIIQLFSAGGLILSLTLPALISINAMAQEEHKTLKEAHGLQVGALVNNFHAIDLQDSTFVLSEALKNGPVIIIFYRGYWCPVCNKHLSNLQDSLQLIYDKGASVVAVSPEKSEFLKHTAEKTHASFSLLYDEDYKISNAFDVTFKPDSATRLLYNTMLGADLKNAHSDESQRLPIPATFIIGQDSKVVWRHFDPDYKKRASVNDIVVALDQIK
jgi:peroxiredoxin